MGYIIKVKQRNKTIYGKRVYKTLAGAKKSISSPSGKRYIKNNKLSNVRAVKIRKMRF